MIYSEYVADVIQHASVKSSRLLGALNFVQPTHNAPQHFPCARVCMLGNTDTKPFFEVFHTDESVSYNKTGRWQTAQSASYIFATHNFNDDNSTLPSHTEQLYTEILNTLASTGYHHLVRMWNYLPDINKDDIKAQERYKSFCYGRAKAFDKHYATRQFHMPAASGVGTLARPACIALIACREPLHTTHIENPLQTPAYAYPKVYGPRSPSFARATCLFSADKKPSTLFISGTAAIRQSESLHADSTMAQLACTIENLEALIDRCNLKHYNINDTASLDSLDSIKLYYRHKSDLPEIRQFCERTFSAKQPIAYLHADICRAELTIEIEGLIQFSR